MDPAVYQEFIPAAMRNNQQQPRFPRGIRSNFTSGLFPQGPPPMRPPRFYYSRPLAPQYMVPRRGGPRYSPAVMRPPYAPAFSPEFHPQLIKQGNNEPPKDCICERDEMMIVCQRCGTELFGRIQRQCPAHPKRIQLMDHSECANKFCRSLQLVEVPVVNSSNDKA
uniref:Uncharacterized protein n=1 Tax=Panagrolaimus superbus TaxID=310955 RepID=A0A914Z6M0_9BILA